jgi:hypothetical protein
MQKHRIVETKEALNLTLTGRKVTLRDNKIKLI